MEMGVLEGIGGAEDLHDVVDWGCVCDVHRIGGAHAASNQATHVLQEVQTAAA